MFQIESTPYNRLKIAETYKRVKEVVIREGYDAEIVWQDEIRFSQITESDFLREASWVVLSSGMRETVIRLKFPFISEAFYFFRSASQIVKNVRQCKKKALTVFGHRRKIEAIIKIADEICVLGFKRFKSRIQNEGISFIQTLPFMGPATSYHLAKNIGLQVVKPDRHLLRVAKIAGYNCPYDLCLDISLLTGDKVAVVDLVIWRYATLRKDYLKRFSFET